MRYRVYTLTPSKAHIKKYVATTEETDDIAEGFQLLDDVAEVNKGEFILLDYLSGANLGVKHGKG